MTDNQNSERKKRALKQLVGSQLGAAHGSAFWTSKEPKPETQDWYWWRPFPEGVEKAFEVYRTKRHEIESWIMCHPYGEMEMGIVRQRWPRCQWSSAPIDRPTSIQCPHCGSGLLWSEDRGAHGDGCDDFNEETDLPNS